MSATATLHTQTSSTGLSHSEQPKPRVRARKPRVSARGPKGFEFVNSDGTGEPITADTRQFIRSHVMRGKNTKKRLERIPHLTNDSADPQGETPSTALSGASSQIQALRESRVWNNYIVVPEGDNGYARVVFPWAFPSPIRMPSDLRLVEFPEVMDDKMRGLMFRFFTAIKETMYPVEWCFRPDVNANCWFQWIFEDMAYYFSVLFVASSFQDIYMATQGLNSVKPETNLSQRLSQRTMYYMRRTIALLQERLNDPSLSVEDISIATVVSLAMVADACGDTTGAKAHVNGLKQMVRLRGGVKGMMSNRHVLSKICRVDLGYSIKYGEPPEFFDDGLSWSPLIDRIIELESPVRPEAVNPDIHKLITTSTDQRLQNVFYDLQAFSSVASRLVTSKSKLRPELFQEIMMSIQYRLLLLKYDKAPVSEALRVGLLTYQTSVFLQMHGTKVKYDFIADQLANAIQSFPETSPILVQIKVWLVFIGSIVVLDSEDPWLLKLVRRLTINYTWAETRKRLSQVMWITPIHDQAGKQVYDGARVEKETVTMGLQRFWTEFLGSEGM